MNELNKLIEQAFDELIFAEDPVDDRNCPIQGKDEFFEKLKSILASRPTCGEEQRKFLDQLEDMGVIDDKVFAEYKIDIDKVIKGN